MKKSSISYQIKNHLWMIFNGRPDEKGINLDSWFLWYHRKGYGKKVGGMP